MSEMKHTPTPWVVASGYDSPKIMTEAGGYVVTCGWSGYGGECEPGEMSEEDAAYIVECVNSHASLVEENARLRAALEGVVSICTDRNGKWHGTYFIATSKLYDAYIKAREALK